MSENQLLLSPARFGVFSSSAQSPLSRRMLLGVVVGCLMVFVGGIDILTRVVHTLGAIDFSTAAPRGVLFTAFAPAVALTDPSFLGSITGHTRAGVISATATSTSVETSLLPVRLTIPSIGVDAKIEQVQKKDDGSMGTPKNINDVGWYSLGAKPGGPGNAVMDGHVNNALSLPGVFAHLTEVKIGVYVTVMQKNGHALVYKVIKINTYPTYDAPTAEIFAETGPSQLVLITCEGDWVDQDHSFDKRLVVVARLLYP